MAKVLYFADLPERTIQSIDRADYDLGGNKMPRIYDAESDAWVRCTRVVIRRSSPSLHKCDSRCANATGRTMQCECSCGGRNHGKGRFYCLAA